jgi:tRNA (guanine6-N2)-methyltransferase
MIEIFATTTRGLESISAAEMARLPGLHIGSVAYRRVTARFQGRPARLLGLRTVDDVFLHLADWMDIVPQRSALGRIHELSGRLNLPEAAAVVGQIRPVSPSPSFSVTANFVGRRNYTSDEIKAAVAEAVTAAHGWLYTAEDESEINLRVFIDHEHALVGVRASERSLHARPYKQDHVSGSLKPSVAAAMLELAEVRPGARLLDPFCGAGTIAIEAALLGAWATAGDRDPAALAAAAANAARAKVSLPLCRWDAALLPLLDGTADCVVTNLPWGRQIRVDAELAAFYRTACAELWRVLAPGGTLALLTSLPDLVRLDGAVQSQRIEISLFGQNPSILIFSA